MDKRLILFAGLVVVAGATGGGALASFATGNIGATSGATFAYADEAPTEGAPTVEAPPDSTLSAPEAYVCKGCGPGLHERLSPVYAADYAEAEASLGKDLPPLPPYKPVPFEGDDAAVGDGDETPR